MTAFERLVLRALATIIRMQVTECRATRGDARQDALEQADELQRIGDRPRFLHHPPIGRR